MDPIRRKVVVNRDVVFDEKLMLKQSNVTIFPDTKVENCSQDKIQVDIEELQVSPRHIVAQHQDESNSNLGGVK